MDVVIHTDVLGRDIGLGHSEGETVIVHFADSDGAVTINRSDDANVAVIARGGLEDSAGRRRTVDDVTHTGESVSPGVSVAEHGGWERVGGVMFAIIPSIPSTLARGVAVARIDEGLGIRESLDDT